MKCRGELRKMAVRIRSGEPIPAPCAQLEKHYVPAINDKALAGMARMKALIYSKRRSPQAK